MKNKLRLEQLSKLACYIRKLEIKKPMVLSRIHPNHSAYPHIEAKLNDDIDKHIAEYNELKFCFMRKKVRE